MRINSFSPIPGILLTVLLSLLGASPLFAQRIMRISLENTERHVQVRMVRLFAERLSAQTGGTLKIEVYSRGSLYRDTDSLSAVAQGKVEMVVPGIWQLDPGVPDFAALMLPSVFGRDPAAVEALADGALGSKLNSRLEASGDYVVVGRWFDLGPLELFGVGRNIRSLDEIAGLSVRVANGRANEERLKVLGVEPVSISLSDFISYAERSLVDGVLTSYETIDSASLDRHGVTSSYEDDEYFGFYVPIVNRRFWAGLDEATRRAFASSWESVVPVEREEARRAQADAKAALVGRGMSVVVPNRDELARTRLRLLAAEDGIAARVGVSREILQILRSSFPQDRP
jgi:TRAP-type C4-dicarboxylate transport system substrate-binding protein